MIKDSSLLLLPVRNHSDLLYVSMLFWDIHRLHNLTFSF